MITLTERKEIIGALRTKREIPTECQGPGEPKTGRVIFEIDLSGKEVVYCPPAKRMEPNICLRCIFLRASNVTRGITVEEIKKSIHSRHRL